MAETKDKELQQIAEKALTDSVVRVVWQKTDEESGEYRLRYTCTALISSSEILWTLFGLNVCVVSTRRATSILPPVRTKN